MADVRLAHIPAEVGLEFSAQVISSLHLIFLFQQFQGQLREVIEAKGWQDEVELEETMYVLVVLQELCQVVVQTTHDNDGCSLSVTHASEQLVELVDVRGLRGGQQFLCIGDEQHAVLQSGNLLVEVAGEIVPVGSIDLGGSLFHYATSQHLGDDEVGDKVLSRA